MPFLSKSEKFIIAVVTNLSILIIEVYTGIVLWSYTNVLTGFGLICLFTIAVLKHSINFLDLMISWKKR